MRFVPSVILWLTLLPAAFGASVTSNGLPQFPSNFAYCASLHPGDLLPAADIDFIDFSGMDALLQSSIEPLKNTLAVAFAEIAAYPSRYGALYL